MINEWGKQMESIVVFFSLLYLNGSVCACWRTSNFVKPLLRNEWFNLKILNKKKNCEDGKDDNDDDDG